MSALVCNRVVRLRTDNQLPSHLVCLFLLVLSYQLIPCLHRKKPLPTNRHTRIPLAPPPEPERPVVRAVRGALSNLLTFLRRPFSSRTPPGGSGAQNSNSPHSLNFNSQTKPDRQHIREKFATQLRLNLHLPPATDVLAPRSPGPRTPRDKKRYAVLDDGAYTDLDEGHFVHMEKPQSARLSPWSPCEQDYPYSSSPTPSRKVVFDYGPNTPPPPFSPPPAYVAGTPMRAGFSTTPTGTPTRATFGAFSVGSPTRTGLSTPPAESPNHSKFNTTPAGASTARSPTTQDRLSVSTVRSTRGLRPLLLRSALSLSPSGRQPTEDPFADNRSSSRSSMLSLDPFAAKSPLSSPNSQSFAARQDNPFADKQQTLTTHQDAADPFVDRSPSALIEEDSDAAAINLSEVVMVREQLSAVARHVPANVFVISDDTETLGSIRSSVSSTWSALTLEEPM